MLDNFFTAGRGPSLTDLQGWTGGGQRTVCRSKSTHRGVKSHRAGRGRAVWGQILKIWQNFLQLTKLSRTPAIVSRIINFNQTMPFLVLDLESFSMCCYLTLVERLLDQWEKQMYLYLSLVEENWRKVAELYHDMERRCYLVWSKWIASITIWRELPVSLLLVRTSLKLRLVARMTDSILPSM